MNDNINKNVAPLSPKSDYLFKLIFGDTQNIELLRAFLMASLDIPREDYDTVELIDPHLKREFEDDKLGILDILLKTKSGTKVAIEIQVLEVPAMAERVTFYTAKLLAGQISSGIKYKELKKAISIVILDYNLVTDSERYHNRYRLCDIETGSLFTDVMEIHTMELNKLPEQQGREDGELYNWLCFIAAKRKEEFEMLATKSPELEKAVGTVWRLSADEKIRMEYEYRERAIRDHVSRIEGAFEKGSEQGFERGAYTKTIEIAKNLLARGMSADAVTSATGLSSDELARLQ